MATTNFQNWRVYQFNISYRGKTRRSFVFTPAPREFAQRAAGAALDETIKVVSLSTLDEAFQRTSCRKAPKLVELQKFFLAIGRAYQASATFETGMALASSLAVTPYFKGVIAGLMFYKQQTANLAHLFAMFPESFGPSVIAMIRQAEATNEHAKIFRALAADVDNSQVLAREIRQGLMYPAMVTVVGIAGGLYTNLAIMPKMTENFKNLGFPLPGITRGFIAWTDFVTSHPWILALPVILLVVAWLKRGEIFHHPTIQRLIVRLPKVGNAYRKMILARSLGALSMLFKNGVYQKDAYEIAASAANHPEYSAYFLAISAEVARGVSPAAAYRSERYRIGKEGREVANEMQVAEAIGDPAEILESVAKVYQDLAMDAAKSFPKVIEPILILGITALVGLLVAAIYYPNFYAVNYALKNANMNRN